jgi:phenylacetate-CoA ligase
MPIGSNRNWTIGLEMGTLTSHLYPYLPVWFQNLGISLYGYAWKRERLGGRFAQHVAEFKARDRWSADEFAAYLQSQLRSVLAHAYAQVPYYGRAWRGLGLDPGDFGQFGLADLGRLPATRKDDLRQSPADFTVQSLARGRELRFHQTSGTTGTPITAAFTVEGHRRLMAAREARSFGWAGVSILEPRSMIGGRLVVPKGLARPPFHRYNRAEKQVYLSAFHISPANAPHYVAALNHYQPKVFTGCASAHYLLGTMMLERGLALDYQPRALIMSAEKLTPQMKAVLRQAFRAPAYEEYGCVENCVLATECEHGRLHASPDFGIVEIVDAQGRPAPPGVAGRILCTSLLNEAQPLVRYELGDLGAWAEEPCPCGRNHLPVLKEVVGRLEDVVTGPDGRQMVRFHGLFIDLPKVVEGQVIQETLDQFTIRVVALDGFGDKEAQVIRNRLLERLGNVKVNLERVPAIPRTERGKFRAVISKLH